MLEFHDYAAGVDYPFVSRTDMYLGSYALPTDVIVDAGVTLYGPYRPIQLRSIRANHPGFTIVLSAEEETLTFTGDGGVCRASGKNSSGFIITGPGMAAFLDRLTVGNDYPGKNIVLEPSRVQALDEYCVTEFNVFNNGEITALGMTGDIDFVPGYNARVGMAPAANSITLIAELGAGEGTLCWPEDEAADPCQGFVRSINGATGDSLDTIRIAGGSGVDVIEYPDDHRLVIDFTRGFVEGNCDV